MIADASVSDAGDRAVLPLDPFAHLPHLASGIGGLGEPGEQADPVYVFHTTYSMIEGPWARFDIVFENLAVSEGILAVQVHILADSLGAQAALLRTESVVLADLVARDGRFGVDFPVEDGKIYAAYGRLATPTDARAAGLAITLHGAHAAPPAPEVLPLSAYGRSSARRVPRLVADRMPTLAFPVSQARTRSQLREPTYRHWTTLLGQDGADTRTGWMFAFVMQTLSRYGMLEKNAYGLGLGVAGEPLPALMAAFGCRIVAVGSPSADSADDGEGAAASRRDALRFPAICPDEVLESAVEYRIGENQDILEDTSFDFCWSTGLRPRFAEERSNVAFFGESLRYVKPGGLVVHLFDLGNDEDSIRRQDIEKMALLLVSHGHLVAQLNFHMDQDGPAVADGPGTTVPFGMILRRSESA